MGRKPLTRITPTHKEIILALASKDMSVRGASKILYMSDSTIYSALNRIKNITGKNPLRFYDLIYLVELAKLPDEPGPVLPTITTTCMVCGRDTGCVRAKYCYSCRKTRLSQAAKARELYKSGYCARWHHPKPEGDINDL